MEQFLQKLPKLAQEKHKETKKYFEKLRKKPPKDLDYKMQGIHDEVFSEVDCLSCANCCKTTGPLFTTSDIDRVSKFMKMKPKDFESKYLRIDEDQDYVLQQLPCEFLAADNYCLIYEVRPKACREYPHTNQKKFNKITNITLKNIPICPAAYKVVEQMKKQIVFK